MNYTNNWNLLDKTIYIIENFIKEIVSAFYSESDKELPDPEEMINAATLHLQEENENLKEYHIPEKVLICTDKYKCPKCNEEIKKELIEKYKVKHCPECGKRLLRVNKSEKSMRRDSVEANVSELL